MSRKTREETDILGAVTAGLIIILIAVLLVAIPTLLPSIITFFLDLTWTELTLGLWWWTPTTPGAHTLVYNGIYIFFLGTIVISIIVLILRVLFRDSYRRQIDAIGNIVMSAGVTWAAYAYLQNYALTNAFALFCGWFIVFAGVNLIISSLGNWVVLYFR
ncbi:MAG: hypothetical protein ACFFDU_06305 [Candidatus Thorarchaeota archaeon]